MHRPWSSQLPHWKTFWRGRTSSGTKPQLPIETFKHLNTEAKKQHLNFKGVSIDPVWFTQFQIKSVPAFVVTERSTTCTPENDCVNQPFDVVYGNASLKKALELIAKKGDLGAKRAQAILESGHA